MKRFLCLFAVIALFSCTRHKAEKVERAFYYWKGNQNLQKGEQSIIKQAGITKLYVKFFEVEPDSTFGAIPAEKVNLYFRNDSVHIIPTVYLRNEVFRKATKDELYKLADNVDFLIRRYHGFRFSNDSLTEYQMDCDWTKSTKDNYFYFLESLKKISKKEISCTLRLYPYKYSDVMGVPPVDRATLMCYNMINPLENKNANSIFDERELKSYLGRDKYPLPLDIALPTYSWMLVYQNDRFAKVLRATPSHFGNTLKSIRPMWYEATMDVVVDGFFVRKGDRIKYEFVTGQKLKNAIDIIKMRVPLDSDITVAFFHLDEEQLKPYKNEEIDHLYTRFTE